MGLDRLASTQLSAKNNKEGQVGKRGKSRKKAKIESEGWTGLSSEADTGLREKGKQEGSQTTKAFG